jgi:ubiquinone/menaquinone biosynthesis C-methylase UbiE
MVSSGSDGTRPVSPGAVPSPNIWHHPEIYELENRAVDPDQRIEAAIRGVLDWTGRDVLDLGCGTGFHLPRWAYDARAVLGVDPHPDLLAIARRRTARLSNVRLAQGSAQRIPAADASIDLVQARWAYFFGPGCEPGLRELDRVVRRGGAAFVVDNDATRSTFGRWFRRGYPSVDPVAVERFWSTHGWQRQPVDTMWRFGARDDLEAVVRIEFDRATADAILTEHDGLEVDYAVNVWWRRY